MEKIENIVGRSIPLPIKDIDTDMIIPAEFLTSTSRGGYGLNVFKRLRETDADFPINQERYQGASILVADDNFGCGSSREHAVWALKEAGFRAVIAKSFADIFYSNALKNGLLPVSIDAESVERLLAISDGNLEIRIDLAAQTVSSGAEINRTFVIDPFRKHCLLNGLDDLDYLISHKKQIEEYFERRAAQTFFSTLEPRDG